MNIEINQKALSLGDSYSISINGFMLYSASIEAYDFFDTELVLSKLHQEKRPRMLLSRNLSFFTASYDLARWDDQHGRWQEPSAFFRTKSFWKSHYQCQCGQDLYDIYTHPERLRSVYRNNSMIGYWTKEALSFLEGDAYQLKADDDCDVELLIGLCLVLDNFTSNNKQGMMHLDLGSLGPEAKAFDESWRPKYAPIDHLWTTSL